MKQITLTRLAHFLALRSEHRTQASRCLSPEDLAILIEKNGVGALTRFRGQTINGARIQAHWPPEIIEYALKHQLLVRRVNFPNPTAPQPKRESFTELDWGPRGECYLPYNNTMPRAEAYWKLISQGSH